MTPPTILWFRQDLRLHDNQALRAALDRGGPVIPVFVWGPQTGPWAAGSRTRWWLQRSLQALDADLRRAGSRLVVREGRAVEVLPALARETGAVAVAWSRRYEPASVRRDARVAAALGAAGAEVRTFPGHLLVEPGSLLNQQGRPFQVFSPFWKAALLSMDPGQPVAAPAAIPAPERWPDSLPVSPIPAPSDDYLASFWTPGEAGARQRLDAFLGTVGEYAHDRNRPDRDGTSRLSPHLHFGEISVRSVWHAMRTAGARSASNWGAGADKFLAEIGWREFSHYLLHHCPHMPEHALRSEFDRFPWNDDEAAFEAWATGRTGYPFVDAGMRQLTAMGWMHNRVRMVTASFLIKDLLLPWQQGARWFWENLVDADLANNSQGWQWTAGSGADAAPFFRVFNPVLQGEKFDPQGAYVRRWLPELAALPADWIHKPWQAPAAVLAAAGVRLRDTYPAPIVDHGQARARALQAFNAITTS